MNFYFYYHACIWSHDNKKIKTVLNDDIDNESNNVYLKQVKSKKGSDMFCTHSITMHVIQAYSEEYRSTTILKLYKKIK